MRMPRGPLFPLLLISVSAAACGGAPRTSVEADTRPPVDVTTSEVALVEQPDMYSAGGVVRARMSATVVARIMAPVREVRVQPGDRVRAGQVLVLLDDRDLAANARSARTAGAAAEKSALAAASERDGAVAMLALARATFDRVSSLHAKKSATSSELDQATANLRAAEARVAGATANAEAAAQSLDSARAAGEGAGVVASYAVITAPFDGIVTEKLIEPGNMASPGVPLLRVDDVKGFRLELRLDESRAASIRTGDIVPVVIDASSGAQSVRGAVSEVARTIDTDARALLVKVGLPEMEGLRSGMFGRADFPGKARQMLTAPQAAVVRHGQSTSVFVVEQDRARVRLVNVGATREGVTEILAGASRGDVVVVAPPTGLSDGQRVKASSSAPRLRPATEGGRE